MAVLEEITIRHDFRPGDIGTMVYMHGSLYQVEFGYGIPFETYVAEGLVEYYRQYNPARERVWLAEHEGKIAGTLLLKNRGLSAQLRYFLIRPEYRGLGLGKKLIELYMDFYNTCGYQSCYLWTTRELKAAAAIYIKNGFILAEERDSEAFGKKVVEQKYILQNLR